MITSHYMEHSITWAFVDVAAFVNRCWSRAFFTSMFGRHLFGSCVGSHTSSAFLVTLADHPVIPFAMNYNIIKVLNNISIIVIQSAPIIFYITRIRKFLTWTFYVHTLFNFLGLAGTGSSVKFFNKFDSGIGSGSDTAFC